jgi:hypothetical protein
MPNGPNKPILKNQERELSVKASMDITLAGTMLAKGQM